MISATVCGGLRRFTAVVCGGLQRSAAVCGSLRKYAVVYGNLRQSAIIRYIHCLWSTIKDQQFETFRNQIRCDGYITLYYVTLHYITTCNTSKLGPLPSVSTHMATEAVSNTIKTFLGWTGVRHNIFGNHTDLCANSSGIWGWLWIPDLLGTTFPANYNYVIVSLYKYYISTLIETILTYKMLRVRPIFAPVADAVDNVRRKEIMPRRYTTRPFYNLQTYLQFCSRSKMLLSLPTIDLLCASIFEKKKCRRFTMKMTITDVNSFAEMRLRNV